MQPDEWADGPYSPSVDPGIIQAIYDYTGRWPVPSDEIEDDYSEESFA